MKLFVGCYGTGVMFSDRSKEEDGDYKHLAFVSDLGGKITWYVKKNSLPEDVIHDVEYQSKVSRDAFRRMIEKKCRKIKHFSSCWMRCQISHLTM